MKIKVLFFAQLREIFGAAEQIIEVSEGLTAKEAAKHVKEEISRFARNDNSYGSIPILYVVNENFVAPEQELQDGDVLALMTPVAGG